MRLSRAGSLRGTVTAPPLLPPTLTLAAPAKVNLTLEVLRRRPDGFHDIRSVMQAINLADRLTFSRATTLELRCSRPELENLDNLVWRAAELLRRETGTAHGARIDLQKRIPVAAGLGGGSSDAATALLGLNALWGLRLQRPDLRELGSRLGSDVPFFLGDSPCALAQGRGEQLTPLTPLPMAWVVLVNPPLPIATAEVYRGFPPHYWSDGSRTAAWLAASQTGAGVPSPFNDLESVALTIAPAAGAARDALRSAGAPAAVMSGSGSTYFALFTGEAEARAVVARLVRVAHADSGVPPSAVFLARFGPLAGDHGHNPRC